LVNWRRFALVAGVFLIATATIWKPSEHRDPFKHWVNVGVNVTILGLIALFLLIDSRKPPTPPENHWGTGAGGIDVWMPLALLALFFLGLIAVGVATSR
jgi:hypothetical protein